ncbi:MAG: NUDIX domain-containing protein [Candidatus Gribaldobacteria bacterium]|nr:NUDIX domain-containing protein [Candidatus Gribaldobacteria bacterium]
MTNDEKRKCSVLIPYKIKGGEVLVYLQKRSDNAKRAPGKFGFFGGGIDGAETPEQALVREIKEELDYTPDNFLYLEEFEKVWNLERTVLNVFCQQVGENFESQIKVLEGDYGQWFRESEALSHEKVMDGDKRVLKDFFQKLKH